MSAFGTLWRGGIAAVIAAVQTVSFAEAQTTLRMGSILPETHYITQRLMNPFIQAVTERTGGAIQFESYPAAQLGADVPATMRSGLLDMGVVISGRHPQQFPLTSVGELPQGANDACEGSARMWALTQPGAILDQAEFAPLGLRVLSAHMLAPYVLYTRGVAIHQLSDIQGLKIWASGPAAERAINDLGGVPIRIASTEVYDSATRGTIDGAIFPYSGLAQYNLQPILNHALEGLNFGSGIFFLSVNERTWDRLSEEHRAIMAEEAQAVSDTFCQYIIDSNDAQRAETAALPGYTVTQPEGAARDGILTILTATGDSWAQVLDAAGRDGTGVLAAYRAALD